LHHHHEGQAPRGDFHGTPLGLVEIAKELIIVEHAELGTELHIEVAFGKRSLHRGHRRLRDRW
jgi:hypothetical protein